MLRLFKSIHVLLPLAWAVLSFPGPGLSQPDDPTPGRQGVPTDRAGRFAAAILGNTEDIWSELLPSQANHAYVPPKMVLFSGTTRSGCGTAQAIMGPFYCPLDRKIYLDPSFFTEMERRFHVGGEFAAAYLIAREVGQHVENLLGILPKVQARQREVDEAERRQLSVRIELMADCLAGVWANKSNERSHSIGRTDFEQAIATARALGDDAVRGSASDYPGSIPRGSAEQRVAWLTTGFESGRIEACNTFKPARP